MRVGVLSNPRSGRNRATALARGCVEVLRERGHDPVELSISAPDRARLEERIDRLIIVGGDGTVHHELPNLLKHQIPFLHLPTGTANLIAREFGMPKRPDRCVDWIERGGETTLDVPEFDGVPFLIMLGAGADAGVIHRFEHARSGSGGYLNYILPVTREVAYPRSARIELEVDGRAVPVPTRANVTIANMRSYALDLNPCAVADPHDGLLDVCVSSSPSTIGWTIGSIRSRLRRHARSAVCLRGTSIKLLAVAPTLFQFDGEIARTPTLPEGVLEQGERVEVRLTDLSVRIITAPKPGS
jgi:diacylglycerol kinase (ATP)